MTPHRRLAGALVDVLDGRAGAASTTASEVLASTGLLEQRYAHLLALEVLAAATAGADPQEARRLLTVADEERGAVGATPWPFEPARHVALRTLGELTPDRARPRGG